MSKSDALIFHGTNPKTWLALAATSASVYWRGAIIKKLIDPKTLATGTNVGCKVGVTGFQEAATWTGKATKAIRVFALLPSMAWDSWKSTRLHKRTLSELTKGAVSISHASDGLHRRIYTGCCSIFGREPRAPSSTVEELMETALIQAKSQFVKLVIALKFPEAGKAAALWSKYHSRLEEHHTTAAERVEETGRSLSARERLKARRARLGKSTAATDSSMAWEGASHALHEVTRDLTGMASGMMDGIEGQIAAIDALANGVLRNIARGAAGPLTRKIEEVAYGKAIEIGMGEAVKFLGSKGLVWGLRAGLSSCGIDDGGALDIFNTVTTYADIGAPAIAYGVARVMREDSPDGLKPIIDAMTLEERINHMLTRVDDKKHPVTMLVMTLTNIILGTLRETLPRGMSSILNTPSIQKLIIGTVYYYVMKFAHDEPDTFSTLGLRLDASLAETDPELFRFLEECRTELHLPEIAEEDEAGEEAPVVEDRRSTLMRMRDRVSGAVSMVREGRTFLRVANEAGGDAGTIAGAVQVALDRALFER